MTSRYYLQCALNKLLAIPVMYIYKYEEGLWAIRCYSYITFSEYGGGSFSMYYSKFFIFSLVKALFGELRQVGRYIKLAFTI